MSKKYTEPKPVQYPVPKAPDVFFLAESIYAVAVGAFIRDTAHRPSIPLIEYEKMAQMSFKAAESFQKALASKTSELANRDTYS